MTIKEASKKALCAYLCVAISMLIAMLCFDSTTRLDQLVLLALLMAAIATPLCLLADALERFSK